MLRQRRMVCWAVLEVFGPGFSGCERELAEVDQADRDQARVAGAVVAGALDAVGGGGLA